MDRSWVRAGEISETRSDLVRMVRLRNLLRSTTVRLLDCRKSTTLNRWLSGWLVASLLLVETVSLSCFLISIGTTPVEGSLMRTLRCIPDHRQGRCLYRDTVILAEGDQILERRQMELIWRHVGNVMSHLPSHLYVQSVGSVGMAAWSMSKRTKDSSREKWNQHKAKLAEIMALLIVARLCAKPSSRRGRVKRIGCREERSS